MLIEFSSEDTGNVLMFGKVATQLLKMMGQSGNNEGAIREADVPEALSKLKTALEALPATESDQDDEGNNDEVSLQTRAVPLIKLLEESVAGGSYIMWKPQ